MSEPYQAILIEVAELDRQLQAASPPLLLDVRWKLGDSDGRAHYEAAHIPAAVYVDLEAELAAHGGPIDGRHPLPTVAALQRSARAWGLSERQPVVVYDDLGGLSAARAWWLLRWGGVADVRILNGALSAWKQAGLALEAGAGEPAAGDVTLSGGQLPVLDADRAATLAQEGVLLDARAAERYRGEFEPIDPRAGHIPGAVSAPTSENLAADGRFADAQVLSSRFAELGVRPGEPVGVYCGSGVTAAHLAAALEIAGVQAALYPGSWSAWSSDPARPLEVGTPA